MALDIGCDERTLRHDLQPAVARAVERRADQLARHAASLDRPGYDGVGEDDRVALHLIGGDSAMAIDYQFEFMLGLVVAYDLHPRRLHRVEARVQ